MRISSGLILVAGVVLVSNQPQFSRVVLLETQSDTSANVSIGDLNGDGSLDLLLVKGRHWPGMSRVLLGDGRGHFPTAHDLGTVKYRSYSGRLVDLDGDGDLDVVLSNDAPDPKVTFLNDGTGNFHPGPTFGRAEWSTRNATVADLNGDRRLDVIVANRGDSAFQYLCLNNGRGRFDADCIAFAHTSATTITAADFNHDGLVDLAVPHRDGGQSYVYVNGGNATFPEATRIPFGPPDAAIRMAEAADLDDDGILDIVAIDERRGVAIYPGLANGTFAPAVPIDNGKVTPYALAVADLNRDGKIDIVVGHVEAPSTIFYNDGSGRHFTPVHFGDNRGTVYGVAIADLDRDGLLDIAVARSEAPSVAYFAAQQPLSTDEWVRQEMARQHIPGAAVAVIQRGKVVKIQGYGFANLEHRIPVTATTVFKIGSVSKQFLATGIMLLAQDGKLQPSDPVAKHVPEAPAAWEGITLRHLLTHTSGLVREGPGFDGLRVQADSVVIASVLPVPLVFPPGTKWQYCNICYFTLADIIRRVSGVPWATFLEKRVFGPAGMSATRTTTAVELVPEQAEGYYWDENKWTHAEPLMALRPSGAFISTARDMARWDAALLGNQILTEASRTAMWTPALLADGTNTRYGFGWQIDSLDGHRRVGHDGSLAGFRSSFMRFPDAGVSVIVLTNLGSANPGTIAAEVARRYLRPPRQ